MDATYVGNGHAEQVAVEASTGDAELDAMAVIRGQLDGLDDAQRGRVLAWVAARWPAVQAAAPRGRGR